MVDLILVCIKINWDAISEFIMAILKKKENDEKTRQIIAHNV